MANAVVVGTRKVKRASQPIKYGYFCVRIVAADHEDACVHRYEHVRKRREREAAVR